MSSEASMEVTESSFDTDVLMNNQPVFVDFWASWCPPCKMMEPIVDRLAEEYRGVVRFAKVNIDRNPGLSERAEVKGVPTFAMYAGGKKVDALTAAQTERKLRALIDGALAERQAGND